MELERSRYLRLAASVVTMLCIGVIYMWSVFGGFVMVEFGWTRAESGLTASIMIASYSVGALVGGRIQDRIGPRKVVVGGALGFFAGIFSSSYAVAMGPIALYMSFGVVAGFSVGCIYTSIVASTQKWFPDRMGVVTGINAMSFGLATLVFSAVVSNLAGYFGVVTAFRVVAGIFLIVILLASLLIGNPPEGWSPLAKSGVQARSAQKGRDYTLAEALKTPQFWLLWFGVLFVTSGFFVFNPVLKQLAIGRGVAEGMATLTVMLVGVGMACGRLLFPFAVERIGQKRTAMLLSVIVAASSLALIVSQGAAFIALMFVAAACSGAPGAIWPTWTAKTFGLRNNGSIFGFILLAIGASSLISFTLANAISQAFAGGSDVAYYAYAACASLVGLGLLALYRPLPKAERAAKGSAAAVPSAR